MIHKAEKCIKMLHLCIKMIHFEHCQRINVTCIKMLHLCIKMLHLKASAGGQISAKRAKNTKNVSKCYMWVVETYVRWRNLVFSGNPNEVKKGNDAIYILFLNSII